MTKFELLKHRYLVIALYPNTKFDIGEIIEFDFENNLYRCKEKIFNNCIPSIWQCPAVFRKLEWFEKIDLEEIKSFKEIQTGKIVTPFFYGNDFITINDSTCFNNRRSIKCIHLEPIF